MKFLRHYALALSKCAMFQSQPTRLLSFVYRYTLKLIFQVLNVKPDIPDWPAVIFLFCQKVTLPWRYMQLLRPRVFLLLICWSNITKMVVCLQNTPCVRTCGVEAATGSLGHGLPIATGEALAIKMREQKRRVFCLISDGETNEGSVWEAALFAAAHKLDNLIVFLDYNKWQATGKSDEILNTTAHADKWRAFGWDVEMIDGHDCHQIVTSSYNNSNKPKLIVADTVKGKGVSFMEDDNNWHYRVPNKEEVQIASEELEYNAK